MRDAAVRAQRLGAEWREWQAGKVQVLGLDFTQRVRLTAGNLSHHAITSTREFRKRFCPRAVRVGNILNQLQGICAFFPRLQQVVKPFKVGAGGCDASS